MTVSRRIVFLQLALGGLIGGLLARRAAAESVTYSYDALGRLTDAYYADYCVHYAYDANGNRTSITQTECEGPPPPPPPPPPGQPPVGFNQTIQITGTAPVNLRTLANNAGYDGAQDATITFQLGAGVTIKGAAGSFSSAGGHAVNTGTWPSDSHAIFLTLQVSGKAYGGGGGGGIGAGNANGSLGTAGGNAVHAQENLTVIVNAGGELKGGGGGGGGGGGRTDSMTEMDRVGGGGGGGFPNGSGGAIGNAMFDGDSGTAAVGAAGTDSSGGAGGAGESGGGGAGGTGGAAGASGANGGVGSGAGSVKTPGSGGAAGNAIRKNGKTVTVTNNGTIIGAVA